MRDDGQKRGARVIEHDTETQRDRQISPGGPKKSGNTQHTHLTCAPRFSYICEKIIS